MGFSQEFVYVFNYFKGTNGSVYWLYMRTGSSVYKGTSDRIECRIRIKMLHVNIRNIVTRSDSFRSEFPFDPDGRIILIGNPIVVQVHKLFWLWVIILRLAYIDSSPASCERGLWRTASTSRATRLPSSMASRGGFRFRSGQLLQVSQLPDPIEPCLRAEEQLQESMSACECGNAALLSEQSHETVQTLMWLHANSWPDCFHFWLVNSKRTILSQQSLLICSYIIVFGGKDTEVIVLGMKKSSSGCLSPLQH